MSDIAYALRVLALCELGGASIDLARKFITQKRDIADLRQSFSHQIAKTLERQPYLRHLLDEIGGEEPPAQNKRPAPPAASKPSASWDRVLAQLNNTEAESAPAGEEGDKDKCDCGPDEECLCECKPKAAPKDDGAGNAAAAAGWAKAIDAVNSSRPVKS